MANINDIRFKALGDQGFTGSFNDRTLKWLKANGATSGNINDAWHQMLSAQGVASPFHVNDGWFQLLGNLGFTGSINDREYAFWSSGGSFGDIPPQVMGVIVTPLVESLEVDWLLVVADPPITGYVVQWKLTTDSVWQQAVLGPTLTYTILGLTPALSYQVRVAAINSEGVGPFSVPVSGTPTGLPGPVLLVALTPQIEGLAVNWQALIAAPVVTSYTVEWKINTDSTWSSQVVGNVLTYSITALTGGILYDVRVYATNALGNGPPSTVVSATPGIALPGQVTNLIVAGSVNALNTSWTAVIANSPVISYTVEYKPNGGITWVSQNVGNVTNFQITGLTSGTLYNVRVYATNLGGNGPVSAVVNGSPFTVPAQVTGVVATPAVAALVVTWNAAISESPVTAYGIEWKLATDSTWTTQTLGDVLTYTINGLTPSVAYDVRVRASSAAGVGPYSVIVQGTPQPIPLPTAPQNLVLTSGNTQLTANWSAVVVTPAVTTYLLEYKIITNATWTEINVGNLTTRIVTGLTNGVTYEVRVRAVNAGGTGPFSSTANTVPLAPPVAPTSWGPMTRNLNSGAPNDSQIRGIDSDGLGVWVSVFQNGYAARSTSEGANWTGLPQWLNSGAGFGTWCHVVRTDRQGVWVAGLSTGFASRSTDNGATWTALPQGLNSGANNDFYVMSTDLLGTWVIAGQNGRASRSINNGVTWSGLLQGLNSGAIGTIGGLGTNRQGVWIAFCALGFASRSTDNGATWTVAPRHLGSGAPNTESGRGVAGLNNVFIAVMTSGYASRSTDYGVTWTALPRGLNTGSVDVDLHIVHDGQSTLVCVTEGGWASYSTDIGVTWTTLPRWLLSGASGDGEGVGTKGKNTGMFMAGFSAGFASRTPPLPVINVPGTIATAVGSLPNGSSLNYNCVATAQMNTPQITIQNTSGLSGTIDFIFDGQVRNTQFLAANATTSYTFNPIANAHAFSIQITARSVGIVIGTIAIVSAVVALLPADINDG
jgi:hypothetical protein